MIKQERHGQLVIARVLWPFPPEDVSAMLAEQKRLQSENPEPSVACLDARAANVLPREVADGLILALSTRRVKRVAVVVAQKFIAELQIERVMKTAGQEKGRVFKEAAEAEAWLGELLTPHEQTLLTEFLAQGTPKPDAK
jgi:hypothetical protein